MKKKVKKPAKSAGKKAAAKFANVLLTGKLPKPVTAHIAIVLDRSGSMGSQVAPTIAGFNTFLAEQKKVPGRATLSLTQFDDMIELVHDKKEIADVPDLTPATFVPRNTTALLDAIGAAIEEADKVKGAKIVMAIITDGMENASTKFSRATVNDLITKRRKKGWEIVFLAANQDAIAEGAKLGIKGANSMSMAANAMGTQSAYASFSGKLATVRSGAVGATMEMDDDDRKKQKDAGL